MRTYAKAKNLGPTELARRLGYEGTSRSWGSAFLAGKKGLPADRLERVAALMGVAVPDLFAATDEEAPRPPAAVITSPIPNLARVLAWEFRRAAKVARRAGLGAQLIDIAWSLERSGGGTTTTPAPSPAAEQPRRRRRG